MNHMPINQGVQKRLSFRIWNFCAYEGVDLRWRGGFIDFGQNQKNMRVRKAPLLKLHDVCMCHGFAENLLLGE